MIGRVKQATLVGIDVTDTLSTAAYVDRLLMQVNQRLYLLSLQSSALQRSSLHLLFNALVIKLTYAVPADCPRMLVNLLPMTTKNKINAQQRPCVVDLGYTYCV